MSIIVDDSVRISSLAKTTSASDTDCLVMDTTDGTRGITCANFMSPTNSKIKNIQAEIDCIDRHTARDISSVVSAGTFKSAIASGTFIPLNIKDGDYFTVNGGSYKYVLADYNYFKNNTNNYANIATNHYSLLVITNTTHTWNDTNDTTGGYVSSALHTYLTSDVLTQVESDMAAVGLTVVEHQKLLSNGINSTGYNRYGTNSGCSNGWAWSSQKISALTEVQVCGSVVWSSSGYDVGEGKRLLNVFRIYNNNDVWGYKNVWLRAVASASGACRSLDNGYAGLGGASYALSVVGLISVY